MAPSAAPPSPQEIQRKLSIHSAAKPVKPPVPGTESDSDSILSPDTSGVGLAGLASPPIPLSSIAERHDGSDSEDEGDEEGGWRTTGVSPRHSGSGDMTVIKAGYLWKKGERRKTWKKRWFVLRPSHLAFYKTAAEYQLLRLLELSDVHSCTQVALKKHENTFGVVCPVRTFYFQAKSPEEVQEWVNAIEGARQNLLASSTQSSVSSPIPIPNASSRSHLPPPLTPSPPSHFGHAHNVTTSDSEDASPVGYSVSSQPIASSPSKAPSTLKDPAKPVLSGYLMKCGSKRRNWRKRWFVLTGEKLVYSASHMDTKPHRKFALTEILDALEYDVSAHRPQVPPSASPIIPSEIDDSHADHTFKIVTTKRALLLCAPSEEDEIKWLGAIRALIARRSGTGIVPGQGSAGTVHAAALTSADTSPPSSGFSSGGASSKGKGRRPSIGGSVLPGVILEEGAQGP